MSGKIRLGCLGCDRQDYDGVDVLPGDWIEIADVRDGVTGSVFDWETHLGICPDCRPDWENVPNGTATTGSGAEDPCRGT
jgi:hypothetical protein